MKYAALAFALVVGALVHPASAKTLEVGAGHELKQPSEAAAQARDGDRIAIDPGEYFDCAVWNANHLTIEGTGPGVVITDKVCQGKALFVTVGSDITIRNITFTRARVPDGNGAGIRAQGPNLTVEGSRFINNENGILSAEMPNGFIRISGSEFERNGKCGDSCAHGIYVSNIALLHIEGSKFFATKEGHHIKSRAARTELVGNDIADGPDGTASYSVDVPNGGSLVMDGNTLEKGPNSGNHSAAVVIGEEGVTQRTGEITVKGNRFTNDMPRETVFLRNVTATEAQLTGNTFQGPGKVVPLSGDGSVH